MRRLLISGAASSVLPDRPNSLMPCFRWWPVVLLTQGGWWVRFWLSWLCFPLVEKVWVWLRRWRRVQARDSEVSDLSYSSGHEWWRDSMATESSTLAWWAGHLVVFPSGFM